MICFCYLHCIPGCFHLVQILNAPEKTSSPSPSLLAHSQLRSWVDPRICAAAWQAQRQREPCPPHLCAPRCTWQLLRDEAIRPGTHLLQHLCLCSAGWQRCGRCWSVNALRSMVPPCRVGAQPGHPRTHQTTKRVLVCSSQAASKKGLFSVSVETSCSACSPGAGFLRAHACLCTAVVPGTLQHVHFL